MADGDFDRPAEMSETDVTLVTRGITVQASVVLSNALALVVTPTAASYARKVGLRIGDPVELFWNTGFEERMLPAEVNGIDDTGSLRWNLRLTGEAQRSTRRKAVRASIELPVRLRLNNTEVKGETLDLSEAGLRAVVDGWGVPPEPGTFVEVDVHVEGTPVRVHGTVIRQEERSGRWVVSLRFDGVPERDGDRLRRRVFQALRELRAAQND